ncbi:glycosyltransferase family 4 protein [Mycobacterium sp. URHB0044]|uniref:glycosyltransferase family 4 protein n=1 Tax=Mycobacterium sp. URHB0044 TaxID=1380386 RepID=UPI0006885ECC|nr:glycosyltransferase family 4 protein [Mycobacterium sp. URHB0044]
MSHARVTMIGHFPPPVGGAALLNAQVCDSLVAAGVDLTRIDVAGRTLNHNRSFGYHARRVVRNMVALRRARRAASRDAALYIVPDAGLGAWYTCAHMAGAARRYGAVMVHHHSCRYIEDENRAIAAVATIARDRAIHVFETAGQATGFRRRYGQVPFRVATNAYLVADEAARLPSPRPQGPIRLGHLSNLCADKGFFAVADAFDALRAAGMDTTLTLAGPILEPAVTERIDELLAAHGSLVRHVGPLAGEAKLAFYRDIDLFVFPTAFRQEGAPVVIYEALAAGCPVLATDRGQISEVIPAVGGAVCARDADYDTFVLEYLREQSWDEDARNQRAAAIKDWIRAESTKSTEQHEAIVAQLAAPLVSG